MQKYRGLSRMLSDLAGCRAARGRIRLYGCGKLRPLAAILVGDYDD